ncbi:MAG: tripartite tricarboxylate transporter TctB family protein [Roseobacter sp.]
MGGHFVSQSPAQIRERVLVALSIFAFGGYIAWHATSYTMGSLRSMGPGYFPLILGTVLCGFAVMVLVTPDPEQEDAGDEDEGTLGSKLRALCFVLGGIITFAALIRHTGFAPATASATIVAALAEPDNRPLDVGLLAIGLTVGASLVFIVALGVPVPLMAF